MTGISNLLQLKPKTVDNAGVGGQVQSRLNNTAAENAADFNSAMGAAKDTARRQFDSVFPEAGGNPLSQLDPEALEQLKTQVEDYLQRASDEGRNLEEQLDSELAEGEETAGMFIASLINLWTQEPQSQVSGKQSGHSDDSPTTYPAGLIKSVNARVAMDETVLSVPRMGPAIEAALVGAREGMNINAAMQTAGQERQQATAQTLPLAGTAQSGAMLPGSTANDMLQALSADAENVSLDERLTVRDSGESKNILSSLERREQKDETFTRMLAGVTESRPVAPDYLNLQLTKMVAAKDLSTPSHAALSSVTHSVSSTSSAQVNSALSPVPQVQQSVIPTPQSFAMNGDMARWSEAMGERLVMMASKGQQEAKIRLDPPELGRLGIKVSLNGDELSVRFHTTVMPVRDIIESRFDQLRTSLGEQGLNLVNVDVETGQQGGDAQQHQDEYFAGGAVRKAGSYGAGEDLSMDGEATSEATLSGHMSSLNSVNMLDAFV
ncbi:flagellar hook-length control protein FliK [Endozoicomonadaceae bacterium StTr2]